MTSVLEAESTGEAVRGGWQPGGGRSGRLRGPPAGRRKRFATSQAEAVYAGTCGRQSPPGTAPTCTLKPDRWSTAVLASKMSSYTT